MKTTNKKQQKTMSAEAQKQFEKDIIGLSMDEADTLGKPNGFSVRPFKIDGVDQCVTMDLRFNRLNIEVEKDKITKSVRWG